MQTFRGLIKAEKDEFFLETGGVRVRLDGDHSDLNAVAGHFATISGEQDGAIIRHATPVMSAENAVADSNTANNFDEVIAVLKEYGDHLRGLPGVLGVRPGFSTDESESAPIIVVVIKQDSEMPETPSQLAGLRVEKRVATARETLRGLTPLSVWEGIIPESVPQIAYTPPTDISLTETPVKHLTCHVGPDSGWPTLKNFLEETNEKLTVAMYEFYAGHIVETMKQIGAEGDVRLNMILQVSGNDQNIENTLRATWGNRLQFTKASVSGTNRVFNNSYHTKVAVRDSGSFWLSSGNWSPSSQPVIAPGSEQTLYRKGNREWHIIVENSDLAKIFEKFIEHDIAQAREAVLPETVEELPDLLVPEEAFFESEAAVLQPRPFTAKQFSFSGNGVKVKPLMSPDNYAAEILKLIRDARRSLYLQFSYIRQPSREKFDEIITEISKKMADGLDVRVLVGQNQDSEDTDLLLGTRRWKRTMFRRQKSKVHNKGIIVDGKITVVGSNNWSSDGTQYNRDASLVFYSRPVARYYTEVFMFDWDNLSAPFGGGPEIQPVIAPESGPTPLGMVRIPWRAWYDD